jgi:outer membrane protein
MKLFLPFICICILTLTTVASAADEVKLGVVDLPKVVQASEAGKKGTAVLKELFEKYQVSLAAKEKELEKLKAALLDGKAKTLSAAKRSAREKELQKKFQEYQEFGKNAQQEVAKKEEELIKPIMDGLEKLVKDYGRANGYAAIAHKGGLVYNDSKYEVKDLSDEILKQFDAVGKK